MASYVEDEEVQAGLRQYLGTWGPFTLAGITLSEGTVRYEYTLDGEPEVEEEPWAGDLRALASQIDWWLGQWITHLDERGQL